MLPKIPKINESLKPLGLLVAGSLMTQFLTIAKDMYPALVGLVSSLPPNTILKIWLFLLTGEFLFLGCISYLLYQSRLIKMFGVLWDNKHTAHCPACKTMLSEYLEYEREGLSFRCIKCNTIICLHNLNGKQIELKTALKYFESS